MASADLREELECSICLSIYADPVNLKCGHNFCRECIDRVLDKQEKSGEYSCPECREGFTKRPALQKNITLCNIAERFLSLPPSQEEVGVSCTYCAVIPACAVKFCQLCEAFLCEKHLKVHSKSQAHVLSHPNTFLGTRTCTIHKKILEYYCMEDAAFICMFCRQDGKHQGHQVEKLDEASKKKKYKLSNILQKMKTRKLEAKKRIQSLQEINRKAQDNAADETKRATSLFRDIKTQLEELEKKVLSEISRQVEQVSVSVSDMIQLLKIKEDELFSKMCYIEELCCISDPITVLQESDMGLLHDDDEEKWRVDRHLHDGGDLDVAIISTTLHTGLSDILTGILVQNHKDTRLYPGSTVEDKVHFKATEPSRSVSETNSSKLLKQHQAGRPSFESVHKKPGPLEKDDISLDINTAGRYIHITDDRKTASWSPNQNYPEKPERFQDQPQVLSSWPFLSGRHYWEVDVSWSQRWIAGMCYPSIARKGDQSLIGNNNKSWCLEGWDGRCSVIHDNEVIQLPDSISSNQFKIYLDYEGGQLSFYDLCYPFQHLHTFTAIFTEPLHVVIAVGEDGRIKISGVNSDM
ncbi:PREDICTED: E3 ubiquitin/ISG15 ligase TRIM25-like [Nanorana parkeri]|uniref:E3 ubiquitin/ISG15 ligase TRIM25-like n=1 Tax=Nanorana parkeri TaxID=125878 RepID=UPI00085491C9|nr:PREDICTED: E3 ubiquitin/ISG15 ligase TRIM25-like [Nanorana parkeri]